MSRFQPMDFSEEARTEALDAYSQWLRGSGEAPLPLLEQVPLSLLKIAAQASLEALPKETSPARRMRLIHQVACWRDLTYGYATRGDLLAGAARGRMVELYEGAALAKLYPPPE